MGPQAVADTPTFVYNRDQIARRIARIVGSTAAGEVPGPQEITDISDAVNAMIAGWQATGLHIWKEKEGTLFLQPNQYMYGMGVSAGGMGGGFSPGFNSGFQTGLGYAGTSNVCNSLAFFNLQTTNVVIAAGTNVIPLSTTPAAIAVGDNFGVMMSNNQLFWSFVQSIAGNVVTLVQPLPQTVNGNAQVFDYAPIVGQTSSCAIYRPLRILNVRRILWSSLIETMVIPMARLDYRNLPNKSNTGEVTQFFYDPQLNVGQFWAWPNPVDSLSGLNFTYMEPLYDFNTAADYPDFPQEWINPIVWNGAMEIMTEYDVGGERAQTIMKRAAETLDLVSGWDREPESYFLGVNFDQTTGSRGTR